MNEINELIDLLKGLKNKKKSLNQYDYIEQFQDSLSDNEKNIIDLFWLNKLKYDKNKLQADHYIF